MYYLLTWGAGEFEFIACVVEGVDRVSVSTTHLLMEGARLMDEARDPALAPPVSIPAKPEVSEQAADATAPGHNPTDEGWE